jgi:transcriptional regulator with XRE-family HTH domain
MKLRQYLDEQNLSERVFAEKIGVKQATVNRYCAGRIPQPDVMRKIVDVTGGQVTANDFFAEAA